MALAPFFSNPETAQVLGWLYIILVNIVGGPYLGQRLSDSDTSEGTWSAIMLLPSFAFLRSVYYAGALNGGGKGVTLTSELYNGFELGMCAGDGPFCRSYLFLAVQWVVLMLLAAYFDRVLPGGVGIRQHPLFLFGVKRSAGVSADDGPVEADDVLAEDARAAGLVENMENEPFDGVVLHRLSKTYPGKKPVRAVRGLSLVARRGEVLCLLAHNGAGKTSAFRTLVGELEMSGGSAYVSGVSVEGQIEDVHRRMGVAPQQDVLWRDMTVQEHLFFYGRVKGLFGAQLKEAVAEAVDGVELAFARRRRVDALSGGMKRRLSVSIALVGSPEFVVLDEPSTGLDLLAREKLWAAILKARENRAVLLTTHSLEEAETLADRVGVMSEGRLRCIGPGDELKRRLGGGHRLSVSVGKNMMEQLHKEVQGVVPGVRVESEVGGYVEYVLPSGFGVGEVLKLMEGGRERLAIRDWAVGEGSLEDVFLRVTKEGREEREGEGLSVEV